MKRTVPLAIASATGLVMIVAWFDPAAQSWSDKAVEWFNILAAIAFVLGVANLLGVHLKKISDRKRGWGYSAVTIVSLVVTVTLGLLKYGVPAADKHPDATWSGNYIAEGSGLWWIFNYVITPVTATMYAMLAFFVASAAFRAFRAKNSEATVLLATALIVLLGKTHTAAWITGWIPETIEQDGQTAANPWAVLRIERIQEMIFDVFNTAGGRAIMIGIALGVVATSLKVILGIDRSYLGNDDA